MHTAAFYILSFAIVLAGAYFKPFSSVLLGFICAILVVLLNDHYFYSLPYKDLKRNETVDAKIEIVSIHSSQSLFYVKAKIIDLSGLDKNFKATPFAMLSIISDNEVNVGDVLTSKLKLKPFRSVKNFDVFDAERFALSERVLYEGRSVGQSVLVSSQQKSTTRESYRGFIFSITDKMRMQWLYYALLTGDRSKIKDTDKVHLKELGLSHLLAISGLHIGLIFAIGFYTSKFLFGTFSVKYSQQNNLNKLFVVIGLLLAFFYVYLSGFIVSATRALLMLACYLIVYSFAKQPLRWRAILYALTILLFFDPFSLLNPGLYFSFIAVIIIFLTLNYRSYPKFKLARGMVQLVIIQCALFLGLLPITLYYFAGISVIGLVINLIAVPLLGIILMPLLVAYSFLSMLFDLSLLWQFFDAFLYQGYQYLTSIPSDWRWLNFYLPSFNLLLLCYIILVILLFSPYKRLVFVPLALALIDWHLTAKGEFKLDVFDVGHGLMVMISANQKALIYDLGPRYFGRFDYINSVLRPYILRHNIEVIATVVSHRDNDHAGGLDSWQAAGFGKTLSTFHPNGLDQACEKVFFQIENLSVRTINHSTLSTNKNDQSCVVMVENKNHQVLLTGDISKLVEQALVESNTRIQSTVLVSPHHGSNTSSSSEFIERVAPDIVIHSAAYQGQWNFPHPEVVKRYQQHHIPQFTTANLGHIRITFYQNDYQLEFARKSQSYWFEED